MWYLKACRACLSTEGKLERIDEKAKRIFYNATEIQVEPGDGLPQYFCTECYTYIKKTMAFRRRSRRAFYVLKEIMMLMKQIRKFAVDVTIYGFPIRGSKVTQNDILQVDRKKTNLVSPLAIWNPEKNCTYYFSAADAETENEIKNDSDVKDKTVRSEFDTTNKENSVVVANLMVRSAEKTDILRTYIAKALTVDKSGTQLETQTTTQSQSNMEEQNTTENQKAEEKVYGEFVKVEPKIVKNSAIVVDIKPDNWMEIEKEAADKKEREIEQVLREIVGEDGVENDGGHFDDDDHHHADDDEQPEEVDLEDIFKGLEEKPEESDDFEWPDPKLQAPKEEVSMDKKALKLKRKQEREMAIAKPKSIDIKLMVKALMAASIRCLSPAQQSAVHQSRMKQEPFRSARFKCTMCVRDFQTMEQIQDHVEYHNGKKKFKYRCQVCMDVFITEEHLNKHCAEMHWYEYQCGACDTIHTSLVDLASCWNLNRKTMNELLLTSYSKNYKDLGKMYHIRPLKQRQMGESMKRWTEESTGAILIGGPRGKYNCTKCKLVLGGSIKWMEHMQMHEKSDTKQFVCDVCDISMRNRKGFERHMLWRHLYSYKCKKCSKTLYTRNQAFYHFNRCPKKKKEQQKRLYCNMCTFYTLGNEEGLLFHQLARHGYIRLPKERRLYPDPSVYCEPCGMYFTHKNWLAAHAAREGHKHTATHGIDVICVDCGDVMESVEQLEEHKRDKHPVGARRLRSQCTKCEMEFEQAWQLREHMENEHDAKDVRMCEFCGKTLPRSAFFKHRSMHTGKTEKGMEEPLTCRFCHSKCYTKVHYICHMLFNHTMKPYCCTLCGCRYQSRTDARDHILKNHAPALPYTCEACDRHFAHLDYLHHHCLKIHGLDIKRTDKSVYLSKRMAGKMFIYEHLKVDGSLIEENILSSTLIEKCDYIDENNVPIPYTDAFFFDPTINFNMPTKIDPPHNNNKRPKVQESDEIAQPVKKKSKTSKEEKAVTVLNQINNSRTKAGKMPYITVKKGKITNLTTNSHKQIPTITIKKEKLQKFKHEVYVEELPQYDAFGNVISDTQQLNDFKTWKLDSDIKSEDKPDMPSLDVGEYNQIIPEYTEEEVVESKVETKEDIIEEQTEFVEEDLEKQEIDRVQEKVEVQEIPALCNEVNVQQSNDEGNSQQSGEETTLTEDVIGELVEHEGKYYVMVDGLLYTIQN